MSHRYRPQRRELLALGTWGMLPLLPRNPTASVPNQAIEICLHPAQGQEDRAALMRPRVLEVGRVTHDALRALRTETPPTEALRDALTLAFPEAPSESVAIPGYAWVWIGGELHLICTQTTTLGVRFDKLETVEVDVEHVIRLT